MAEPLKDPIYQARKPTENEIAWVAYGRDLIKGSATILDDEAKSLVALGSSLITLYIAALTFLKTPDLFALPFIQTINEL